MALCCAGSPEQFEQFDMDINQEFKSSFEIPKRSMSRTARQYYVGKVQTHRKLHDVYDIPIGGDNSDVLGTGMTGFVCVATSKDNGEKYAVKQIFKQQVQDKHGLDMYEMMMQEYEILSNMDHPNIVRLHEVFEEEAKAPNITITHPKP